MTSLNEAYSYVGPGEHRGAPPKKGTDQFYLHDDELYWITVVFC